MMSHQDSDSAADRNVSDRIRKQFLEKLEKKAKQVFAAGGSQITAGKVGEKEIAAWNHGSVHVTKRPDDELGIIRISIGGGDTPVGLNYCVFRGDREQCIKLLKDALEALENPPQGPSMG